MDLENNLSGYRLEKSTNGGSSWNQIYQGTATSKTDTISGITQVMYRVKAYDALGLESGYKTSSNVSIRFKPSTPGSISIPDEINDGQNITITWTASTDTNSNLAGYRLEKSTDGGTQWAQIYQGSNLSYSEVVVDISQVQYRVKAYDDTNLESGYATTQNILVNRYPTIQADIIDGTNLGVKDVGFTINYTVSDQDANSVTVIEMLDSNELRSYTVTLGEQNTFDVSGLTFMKLSNGEHTLQIIANDGKVSTTFTVYFTKEVTSASVTLETAMTKPGKIMVCNLTVEGSISADALFRVEVSNNANDTSPVWEDCTTAVRNGVNYVFFNKTAEAGFAFNFKVAVKRGDSNTGGYITKVSGKFA